MKSRAVGLSGSVCGGGVRRPSLDPVSPRCRAAPRDRRCRRKRGCRPFRPAQAIGPGKQSRQRRRAAWLGRDSEIGPEGLHGAADGVVRREGDVVDMPGRDGVHRSPTLRAPSESAAMLSTATSTDRPASSAACSAREPSGSTATTLVRPANQMAMPETRPPPPVAISTVSSVSAWLSHSRAVVPWPSMVGHAS